MGTIRLEITFKPIGSEVLILPIHYNHIVQSVIYNSLDDRLASFLHDFGYKNKKRAFRLFTFSRLIGRFELKKDLGQIFFHNSVKLVIMSPISEFCNSLVSNLLLRGKVKMGKTEVSVLEARCNHITVNSEQIKVKTLSPIVTYSTLFRTDGRKYTCYFQPNDADFHSLIQANLKKKYLAFYQKEPPDEEVQVQVLPSPRLAVINYKKTIIKGDTGRFIISGPSCLLKFAVEGGIGSKNSQGFGCLQIMSKIRR